MHSVKPQLASVSKLQTRSADTEHNKFKRALHDTIAKLKEYQTRGVEPCHLILCLIQDIYNTAGTRDDKALNHIRNILNLGSDHVGLGIATSFITGKIFLGASHTKFLAFLAILHDRNNCVDDHGKIKSDKVIHVIQSLFQNADKIAFDKKQIEEIIFDYKFSDTEHKVVLNEIFFGKKYPSFKLTAYIKDDQNLDLNHIGVLIKYGNTRFSKKYETGTFERNYFGVCAVSSYEYLTTEAKAYHAGDKDSKTRSIVELRDKRIFRRENTQEQSAIHKDYDHQISLSEQELRKNSFFKMSPIEGTHSELPELIRKVIRSSVENYQSIALCYIHYKSTTVIDDGGHAMALSITKKTKDSQNYFFLKFTDPNTQEGPILLEVKEEDLQKNPLDFSKDIHYISQQLKLNSDVTIESYFPLPRPDDKEYALSVLKTLCSSQEDKIKNRISIEQILSTANWISEEISKELFQAGILDDKILRPKTLRLFLDTIQNRSIGDDFLTPLLQAAIRAHKPDLTRLLLSYLPQDQTTIDYLKSFLDESLEGTRVEATLRTKILEIETL